jgi:hypothetical protein
VVELCLTALGSGDDKNLSQKIVGHFDSLPVPLIGVNRRL